MTFRFIEVDEIIGNEIEAMKGTIDPKMFDDSLETVEKLTGIQSKMFDNEMKSRKAEFEREKDLREFELRKEESAERRAREDREFEFRMKQSEREFELRMKELDIHLKQVELERLRSDREFELKMRELDEKAEDKKFNWYNFFMDIADKFGVAGLMAMILHYEKFDAITSKAWQIVLKCIRLRH